MNLQFQYRKKPVIVEAFQNSKAENEETGAWPQWLLNALRRGDIYMDGRGTHIKTLEGELHVSEEDWIIRGVKGELYPCKPDIFEETYEKVEE